MFAWLHHPWINPWFNIIFFPFWWYVYNWRFWGRFYPRTLLLVIDLFSFTEVLRVFFKPFRRDFTWVGYLMGIIVRTVWLLASGVVILLTFLVLTLLLFLYLLLPVIGFLLLWEPDFRLQGLFLLALIGLWYYQSYVRGLNLTLAQARTWGELRKTFLPCSEEVWRAVQGKSYSPPLFWQVLIRQPRIEQYLVRLGLGEEKKWQELAQAWTNIQPRIDSWERLFWAAREIGLSLGRNHLSCELLFLAWVRLEEDVLRTFEARDLVWEQLEEASQWMYARELRKQSWKYWQDRFFHRRSGIDVGWAAGWIPHLKHFSLDITELVKQGRSPYLIGRKELVKEVIGILEQTTRHNVLLIGPPGVGKTTLAFGIAQRIVAGEVGAKLAHKRLVMLDLAGLLAGAGVRGEMEARIKFALQELQAGERILFIDEIHALLGGTASGDIGAFFGPALSAGNIQLIATTTPEDYRRYIENNPTFASYFQNVFMEEPSFNECVRILEWFVPQMEADRGVRITMPALTAAVELTQKYVHDRYLPGKAIELLDQTVVWVSQQGRREITAADVAALLSQKINIPLEELNREEKEKLLNLEQLLHQRIIDQVEAVEVVSNALRRARSGLAPGDRPIASFLFVGPTGVGKTETAKALSAIYFGSERNMIRIDMSEYAEPGQVYRLIGPPPGQPGYEMGGYLTEAVRSRPFAVVLLDEIEKAHPEIHNLLLQILDDGRLTDGKGRTIDFTNTMIICTSNAFSVLIQESLRRGETMEKIQAQLLANLQQVFRPELLNRFDGIIIFKTLSPTDVRQIVELMLAKVQAKMREQRIEIAFDPLVVEKLAELGYSPEFGARPLRRLIQEKVEDKLARLLLNNSLVKGTNYYFQLADLDLESPSLGAQ